jgi:hypothetical protein
MGNGIDYNSIISEIEDINNTEAINIDISGEFIFIIYILSYIDRISLSHTIYGLRNFTIV